MSHHLPSRRDFAGLAAAAAFGFGTESFGAQASDQPQLRSEFLMEFDIELDGPGKGSAEIGHLGAMMVPTAVTGGWFEGPKLKGRLVPPGGDWLIRRPDGSLVLDLRVTMQTEDGAKILMAYRGVSYSPKGGPFYLRITPVFETSAERYLWLNNIVSVGVSKRPAASGYRVYQIL
jgi:hypothetical protein